MKTKHAKQMLARLVAALDPLRARLRRDELKALAGRLARKLPDDPAPLPLILALLEEADAAVAERRDRHAGIERLADALETHGPGSASILIDDAAGLDLDAVVEREARAVGRLDGLREICLCAAGALAAGMMVAGPTSPPQPSRLAPEAGLPARILGHAADRAAPWTVRVAALDAARALLAAWPWPMPAPLVTLLDRMADDGADSRWVQIAALRALGVADLGRARARARARVLAPRATADDSIVRARAARLLLHELHDPAAGAALGVAARDASEHVRQSVARACATSGDPACGQLLAILSDETGEHSPRVRAVAALVHAERAGGSAGPLEQVPAARALARVLVWDRDALALGVAADAAADRCRHPEVDDAVRDILATALGQARARADLPPPVANAVARAAERAGAGASGELRARLVAALATSRDARVKLPDNTSDDDIGRALAELAQGDLGLYAQRDGDSLVVKRGERLARRAWRVLHELRRPQPSKRQGYLHTVGRVYDGELRAHPSGMAEIAPTRVPGERVFVRSEGGWGGYLPLVDDLLSLGDAPARLYSEHGCTVVRAPESVAARLSARARLTNGYAELASLRLRSLEARDAAGRGAYLAALRELGFGIRFEPYDGGVVPAHVAALFARRRRAATVAGDSLQPVTMAALAPLAGMVEGLGRMFGDPGRGGVGELALFTAAAATLLTGRSLVTRADIAACRRAIPLVVGGWGTRGKSGVERLKAALFHALGYEVVAKTTGCEATLLIGVPGQALTEVPLYRPYEKATIWEQRDVLRFAGVRRPQVLLWECMALNPSYVDLLQRGWMRDDISTVTNAYPDHEDIQGPSGADVADVIAGFTPSRATLVTAEDQMLPVIRERARREQTRLVSVGPHAHELLPADLLARFPYQEHPRNVALVMSLAEELGVDPEVALVEMADHVLADVGGLRTFGPLAHAGRLLRFHNGMSANERASALGNWQRLGLDAHRTDDEPGRWIVAFVNNRADRAARTAVFADALVDDFAAHRVVLAGSNTSGMRQAIEKALAARLERLTEPELPLFLERMKIGAATVPAALAELEAWVGPAVAPAVVGDGELAEMIARALAADGAETMAAATHAVESTGAPKRLRALLEAAGVEDPRALALVSFARLSWTRRRMGAGLVAVPLSPATVSAVRELYLERLVEPHVAPERISDGDMLVAALADACPPGVTVEVMGLANIKGPGLALVHLFAGADRGLARVVEVEVAPREAREAALARLATLEGLTPLGLRAVADRLEAVAPDAMPVVERLRARAALAGRGELRAGAPRPGARLLNGLLRSLDHLSSSTRRRRADRLFSYLASGRVAVARAARELGDVNLEQRL